MHLTVLGSAGSYPVPGRPASGYLITHGETRVWCDAGPGTFSALADALDLELVSALVISHRHPDHCIDLLAAFHRWAYAPDRREGIPLYLHESVWDAVVSFLDAGGDHDLHRVFDVHPVDAGDSIQLGEVAVSFARTHHSVPNLASRWEADGRVLVYTGDTGPDGDWHPLAAGSDLLLAEATFQGERAELEDDYPYHLTATEAGQIARAQGVGGLMLTHIPVHLDPLVSVAEAEAAFGRPVEVAVPGTRQKV